MAFHYATVGPHEALLFQLDGNNEENTPAHAVAVIRSIHYVGSGPTTKDAPPAK